MNKSDSMLVKTKNDSEVRKVYALAEKLGFKLSLGLEQMMFYKAPLVLFKENRVTGYVKFADAASYGYSEVTFEQFLDRMAGHVAGETPMKIGEYTAEFKDNGVQVGCTFVDKETVKAIYERMFSK